MQFGHDQVLVGWGTRRRQKHHLTSVICDFVAAVTCGEKAPEREKPDSHWKQGASKFSRIQFSGFSFQDLVRFQEELVSFQDILSFEITSRCQSPKVVGNEGREAG